MRNRTTVFKFTKLGFAHVVEITSSDIVVRWRWGTRHMRWRDVHSAYVHRGVLHIVSLAAHIRLPSGPLATTVFRAIE